MIQSLRKNAAIIMWVVIVAFVATIVFAWGMDLSGRNHVKDSVGKINGKDISLRNFEREVNNAREKEREQNAGAEASAYQSRMIPRQVWDAEVKRILLRDVFSSMKIGASADEIFEFIKKNPPPEIVAAKQFQTNGVFDTTKFVSFLNNPEIYDNQGMLEFERSIREFSVPMQSIHLMLSVQDFPTKAEISYDYKMQNEKARFEYAKVNVSSFAPDKPSDAAIAEYYSAHPDSFVTDDQADLYFVKIPKVATPADKQGIYNDLATLRDKIKPGDSAAFAEQAKAESDDEASATQGGDLGWIAKGSLPMMPQFDSALFATPVNQVSTPILTRLGYHLVLVEQRETKDGKEMARARHILRKIVPSAETIDRLNAMADSAHGIIISDGIRNVSKKISLAIVDSTGLFKRGDLPPKVGIVSGAASYAFNRTENEVSDLLENEEGYFIFQVKRKVKKGILPLEVAREKIEATLNDRSRLAKAKKHFEDFLAKVPDKADVAHYSKYDTLVVSGISDTVARLQYSPVGYNTPAVAAAFTLPDGKVSSVIDIPGLFCVVKPVFHKKAPDVVPWGTPEVMAIKNKLVSEAVEKNFEDWLSSLRNSAKIVDNLNQFYLD
jgi:parvulin-like peptidyl-prolyl isomerase